MTTDDFYAKQSEILNALARAAKVALAHQPMSASARAAIPGTSPQAYVVAGTPAAIAEIVSRDLEPAAATVLTDERIDESALNEAAWKFIDNAPDGSIPALLWNNPKAALRPAIQLYVAKTALTTIPAQAQAADEVRAKPEQIDCWSRDEEDFNARSLSDLLDTHDDLKPGDTVWMGQAVHPEPERLVSEDWIIEHIGEQAYDIAGEYAEDYPDVTPAQASELESLIADWIRRNCPPTFYTVANIKPYVLSHEDFPIDSAPVETGLAHQSTANNGNTDDNKE